MLSGTYITHLSLELPITIITKWWSIVSHFIFLRFSAGKYPIKYDSKPEEVKSELVPTILDLGCGYGGLMFSLAAEFPD